MNQRFKSCFKRMAVFVIPLSILVGCAGGSSSQPTVSAIQASLTAVEIPVKRSSANNPEAVLKKDETVSLQPNDGITVDKGGRGLVRFKDRLVVDVFRGSEFILSDVKLESGDALFVTLRQTHGHTRVALSENANARVKLVTDFATITTLREGTEFIVCQDPTALTCVDVRAGEVEVVGQGKVVTVKAGEATYILKDKPPFSAICAQPDEVNAWLDKMLGSEQVEALGELVASWKQEPCGALVEKAPGTAGTPRPLPPSEGMVKIEAGTFTVGSTASDEFHITPLQKKLAAFWMDMYEVTNAQYKKFMDATGHAPPQSWPGQDKQPVHGVTWDEAAAYCTWANKRLPAEAEWEVAARGPGPNPPLYPWGSDPDAGGKINDLSRTETHPVGAATFNKSPFGVYDMAGNVWEWVGDPYYPVTQGFKVLRGGRYGLIRDMAYRQPAEPNSKSFVPFAGFRCAADQVEGK